MTGHKLGGPVGVGALVLGRDVDCAPLLHGGGQERDVRSGTLDVPAIAAFALAVEIAVGEQAERSELLAGMRDDLVDAVLEVVPDAQLNGDPQSAPESRLPGNAHFSFPGCEGDALLMLLDAQGVECSTGSACSAGVARPSHVLIAMGHGEERAKSSLRFTLGHTSTAGRRGRTGRGDRSGGRARPNAPRPDEGSCRDVRRRRLGGRGGTGRRRRS